MPRATADGFKVCSKCGHNLPVTEFYVSRARPDGRLSACKPCSKRVEPREIEPEGFKRCSSCRVMQPLINYNRSADHRHGVSYQCRSCASDRHASKPKPIMDYGERFCGYRGCGSPLPRDGSSKMVFCGSLCSGREYAARKRDHRPARTCARQGCTVDISALSIQARYCSSVCYQAARRGHAKESRCCENPECGADITVKSLRSRFCGKPCSLRKRHLDRYPRNQRYCALESCSTDISHMSLNAIFCSVVCRNAHQQATTAHLTCVEDGCNSSNRIVKETGMCQRHHTTRRVCVVPECGSRHLVRESTGLCQRHSAGEMCQADDCTSYASSVTTGMCARHHGLMMNGECIRPGCNSTFMVRKTTRLCNFHHQGKEDYECRVCGRSFVPGQGAAAYCSDRCRDLSPVKMRLPTLEICDRDGWICQLCGSPIDPELSYPHPMSAQADHIYPWSIGGSNNPINLQASHYACNNSKRATVDFAPRPDDHLRLCLLRWLITYDEDSLNEKYGDLDETGVPA